METTEKYEIWVCVDCLMLIANGDSNPEWSEEDERRHLDNMEQRLPSDEYVIALGDLEREFDKGWCDSCGSKLHGYRQQMWAFKR